MQQDEKNGSQNQNVRKSDKTAQEKNKGIQSDSPQRNQGRGLGRGGGGFGGRQK